MNLSGDLTIFVKRVVGIWGFWIGIFLDALAFAGLWTQQDLRPASWLVLAFLPLPLCYAAFALWREDHHRLQVALTDDADIRIEQVLGSGFLQVSARWNDSPVPKMIILSLSFRLINRGKQLGTLIEAHVPEPRLFQSPSISPVNLGLFLSPSGGQHLRPGTTMGPGDHFPAWHLCTLRLSDEVTPEALIDELRGLADRKHSITWRFPGKRADRTETLEFDLPAEPIVRRLTDDWRGMGHQVWATAVETPHP